MTWGERTAFAVAFLLITGIVLGLGEAFMSIMEFIVYMVRPV